MQTRKQAKACRNRLVTTDLGKSRQIERNTQAKMQTGKYRPTGRHGKVASRQGWVKYMRDPYEYTHTNNSTRIASVE